MATRDSLSDLNPAQRDAVRHIDGPLLVLAGAGSGKTRTLTRKIAFLAREAGYPVERIYAVTFTNKAAREMRERARRALGDGVGKAPQVSTFHTLGLNLLRREHRAAGLKSGFSIFDGDDSDGLLKELCGQHGVIEGALATTLRWRISDWKNALVAPAAALAAAADEHEGFAARLYGDYQRHLAAYNAVDFDDLIRLPVELLRADPELRERWQNRVRYLLVDEYQDTNGAQYELVRLLTGVRANFTVVGDDDQSIYAWRGARPENLAQLRADYPRLRVVMLEQNYRSTGRILRAANHLIGHNPHLFEKRLWSELGDGEPIRIRECQNDEQEAERVASEILHRHLSQQRPYGDFAILYRGNHQARGFEKALRENDIRYFISGGQSFFARSEIKDLLAYLRLLANPADDAAFLRIVNTPRREIGATTLERLADYARERNAPLLAVCAELGLGGRLGARAQTRLAEFSGWLERSARRAEREPADRVLTQLLADIDYPAWLRETSRSEAGAARRQANVDDLVQWIARLAGEARGLSLGEVVTHLTLQDVLERQDEESGDDRVALMTLHAAKGLEFPHVFLVGAEEELLPHRSSIEEGTIEEERRLAYVGITRARRTLTITWCSRRRRYGELVRCEPSRFLAELPEAEVERLDGGRLSAEEHRARASSHLARMKSLLAE